MSASAYWKSKGHNKEAAKDWMLSMDTTNDERRKLVNEQEACKTPWRKRAWMLRMSEYIYDDLYEFGSKTYLYNVWIWF